MEGTQNLENIRQKVEKIENNFKEIHEGIAENLKQYDDILLENRQAYESLNRNLDDVKEIYENDLNKFEEQVDKSIIYNDAIFQRVEKDAKYLNEEQANLNIKILAFTKRAEEMEAQIGSMEY